MNSRKIKNLGDPVDDDNATNKKYVDGEIANLHVNTSPLLPRDGSRSMTGNLDMDDNYILNINNLANYKDTDSLDYRHKDLHSAVNKHYLNENFLKTKGYNYDLGQKVIKNSAPYDDGSYDNNTLVSKAFIDNEINKLPKNVLLLDGSKKMTGD